MAEREGFEPSIRFWRILTFQASAFDHSATAPHKPDRIGLGPPREPGAHKDTWKPSALAAWGGFRKHGLRGTIGG